MTTEGQHPTAEELVAYALGESNPETAARLRPHVESCAECHALTEDLAEFPNLEPPDERYLVTDDELRRTRGMLRARWLLSQEASAMETEEEQDQDDKPPPLLPFVSSKMATNKASVAAWLAMAATLVLAIGWGYQNHRRAERLQASQADWLNVAIVTLIPSDDPMRSSERSFIALDKDTLVVLDLDDASAAPLTAEIRTAKGQTVRSFPGLEPKEGFLRFGFQAGELAAGEYRIFLVKADGDELPVHFDLPIVDPPITE